VGQGERKMLCKTCGKEMMKAGSGWSGNREVRVYRCNNPKCPDRGSRHMNSKEPYIRKEK